MPQTCTDSLASRVGDAIASSARGPVAGITLVLAKLTNGDPNQRRDARAAAAPLVLSARMVAGLMVRTRVIHGVKRLWRLAPFPGMLYAEKGGGDLAGQSRQRERIGI